MSQVHSRPSSPKPQGILTCEEANLGDGTTPGAIYFVQNDLFALPRSQVLKSGFFREMMESPHLGNSEEGTTAHPIVFDERTGITQSDMKSCCAALDIRAFQATPKFSITEWASAYRLANMWEFEQLRDYILKHLNKSITDPLKRIEIADDLGIDQWIAPALAQLCNREAPLTPAEGVRLGFKRFAEVSRLREHPRQRFQVSEYEKWLNKRAVSNK
ncbi:hypothetical protein M407DRAFT_20475 [Tulasnella calospora MUT 4182]|uniref:BTB domain-containing protein n=1 Tax=Tulasnella calospora MUT 4182 TaxID=1051891 RepID=A0A0C3L9A7_9AGAM|nr:hypothetical protein M407DRAFT_20475 [Tulasnella calospora MUT 4182]